MEFLGEVQNDSAVEVINFVRYRISLFLSVQLKSWNCREVMERFQNLRPEVLQKLLDGFSDMRSSRVFRGALWIVGEYALDAPSIEAVMATIRSVLGEVPILDAEQKEAERIAEELGKEAAAAQSSTPAISAPTTRVVVRRNFLLCFCFL